MLCAWNENVKLLLLDHICSPSGWVLPIEEIVAFFEERGTMVLVDGAHALGQIPLDLRSLGASFYVANAHKWLCAPKEVHFYMHVKICSHKLDQPALVMVLLGCKKIIPELLDFKWDSLGLVHLIQQHICAFLIVSELRNQLHVDGITGIQRENTNRARAYRKYLVEQLGGSVLAPDDFVGHMGSFLLEKDKVVVPTGVQIPIGERLHPLWKYLYDEHQIEVVVFEMQECFVIRYSVQVLRQ